MVRRAENGNICAATNSALTLATGEFVALMDHDDILPERALYEVAALLQDHPDADLIYSDEDKIDTNGRRYEPYFKTAWNPELILSQNFVSHLGVYRRSIVEAIGGSVSREARTMISRCGSANNRRPRVSTTFPGCSTTGARRAGPRRSRRPLWTAAPMRRGAPWTNIWAERGRRG